MYDIRDLVPWSLVYAAQNKRHREELANIKRECEELKEKLKWVSCMVVKDILLASISQFNNPESILWKNWSEVKQHLTVEDISETVEDVLDYKRDNNPWHEFTEGETRTKGNILVNMLKN